MNKIFIATLLAFTASLSFAETIKWYDFNTGYALAQKQGKPIVVDFFADWCTWCHKMDTDVLERSDVSSIINSKFIAIRIDTEKKQTINYDGKSYSARSFMEYIGVTGLPTFLFIDKKGKAIGTQPGYIEANEFKQLLGFIHSDSYKTMTYSAYKARGGK